MIFSRAAKIYTYTLELNGVRRHFTPSTPHIDAIDGNTWPRQRVPRPPSTVPRPPSPVPRPPSLVRRPPAAGSRTGRIQLGRDES